MRYRHALLNPSRWLLLALAYCLLGAAVSVAVAIRQPWLGLTLDPLARESLVQVREARGPSAQIPGGAILLAIGPQQGGGFALQSPDLMEEPDVLALYSELDAFFLRQDRLAGILAGPSVDLHYRLPGASGLQRANVTPVKRPVSSLPLLFWFQLVISVAGCMVAAWVWVLQPRDWGARMFGVTGVLFPLFVMPAAIYGSRELALPGGLFQALSAMNHGFAYLFGAVTACIFACYPRPLVRPSRLWWVIVLFGAWGLSDLLRWAPDIDWGNRFLVTAEFLLCVALAVVQWRRSRGEPIERAALRWLFLSLLVGSGLFIITSIMTVSLGWLPPLPQGYAFGFFLLIYIGIALGLRRYRLFDLDQWAYRLLVWVGGALVVIGLDALLILALDWSAGPALGVSLWACGVIYFPIRQWLWQWLVGRPKLQLHELMPDVVQLAFQSSRSAQRAAWDSLLVRLFDPAEIQELGPDPIDGIVLEEDGLALLLPAFGNVGGRRLRYPDRGRRLFSSMDVAFMEAVLQLMVQAQEARDAQERGVREERRRIARDMHDDVGARLLMLIHRAPTAELAELARASMSDLRTALAALDAPEVPLSEAMADWRAEAATRCDAAGVALQWQPGEYPSGIFLLARHKSLLERALREGLTNALKHARPTGIRVLVEWLAPTLVVRLQNDGGSANPDQWTEGRGLSGMRQRLAQEGAELVLSRLGDGMTELRLALRIQQEGN